MTATTVRRRPDERCVWCGVKLAADVERPKKVDGGWVHSTCVARSAAS